MRTIRPGLAIAATLSLVVLAGCSAAAPEERAAEEYHRYLEALNSDAEVNFCADSDATVTFNGGPWRVAEGKALRITPHRVLPETWEVQGIVQEGDEPRLYSHIATIRVANGEEPCVVGMYGFGDKID